MQALSENSPDLITRFTHEGEVFYINPMIENYTGHKPSDLLNKKLEEIEVQDLIKQEWVDLLKEVEDKSEKVNKEMDFPSIIGDRVMQVNAIPEFDEENLLESILMVSHDITERKQIELEIQSKNRKITESINYAKRIQGAILPNNAVIRQIHSYCIKPEMWSVETSRGLSMLVMSYILQQ
jgi:PAS domain S-box-containing protein